MRLRLGSRGAVIRLGCLACLLCLLGGVAMWMPGRSHQGALPPLSPAQMALAADLRADVTYLAGTIGERNLSLPGTLDAAAAYMDRRLRETQQTVHAERFGAQGQTCLSSLYNLRFEAQGQTCSNFDVRIEGAREPTEIVVIGAHYDSTFGTPGADDNASAVAALLALAQIFAWSRPDRTLRFVAFANEEYFQQDIMGSLLYARACRAQGENIVAMVSLEMLGYYTDAPRSQSYPPPLSWFYPSTGDFVAFVGNLGSSGLVRRCLRTFRAQAAFPSEGAAMPGFVPGVSWSDHWSFWKAGYDAIMVTDTAFFRNHSYHQDSDRPETLDYERMARVVDGLRFVVADLAGVRPVPALAARPASQPAE
jgi:hypothetical protein